MAGMLLAIMATTAMASPKPIWERYPRLICHSTAPIIQCTVAKGGTLACSRTGSMNARWDVNFAADTVTYLGFGKVETIVGKAHNSKDTVSMDSVLLSSARMITWMNDELQKPEEMDVSLVESIGGVAVITTWFKCFEASKESH